MEKDVYVAKYIKPAFLEAKASCGWRDVWYETDGNMEWIYAITNNDDKKRVCVNFDSHWAMMKDFSTKIENAEWIRGGKGNE